MRGRRTLFRVPFRSAMTDADAARLCAVLDLATHLLPKPPGPVGMSGVARLDSASGLYLVREDGDDRWCLEGRTWGTPSPAAVRGWHVRAADAARMLDPSVPALPPETSPARAVHPGAGR